MVPLVVAGSFKQMIMMTKRKLPSRFKAHLNRLFRHVEYNPIGRDNKIYP